MFHLGAIFGFVEVLEVVWCFSQTQMMRFFSRFWDELVDWKVIWLDAVASNLEQLRIGQSVGQPVDQ